MFEIKFPHLSEQVFKIASAPDFANTIKGIPKSGDSENIYCLIKRPYIDGWDELDEIVIPFYSDSDFFTLCRLYNQVFEFYRYLQIVYSDDGTIIDYPS